MTECKDAPEGKERRESCPHAENAADLASDKAVKKTFAILGVDVDRPDQVEEFRKDLRFSGQLRSDFNRGRFVLVGLIATAIGVAIWEGMKVFIVKG